MAQQTCNQFEPTTNTSSATICKWCGQEKFLHALKVDYMAQQTAVEWLFETMAKTPMTNWYDVREQALQMEKEQLDKAYYKGQESKYIGGPLYTELYNK